MIKYMNLIGIKARKASEYKVTTEVKNKVLNDYAKLIKNEKKFIINQNSKDINYARKKGLKENLIKRLHLNENKLDGIINSILKIAKLRDPIDNTLDKWKRPNGLNIKRVSIPIGVIGVIYESRPNVTSDVASLCFKSGNVVILKGGSEAINSNKALAKLFRKALKKNKVDENFIQFIDSKQRRIVDIMLSKMKKYIDVIIPRGGKNLVKKVLELSKVPTIGHLEGLCHVYLDNQYNYDTAEKLIINSKLRRTSICGAAETLLIHKSVKKNDVYKILRKLNIKGCKIIGDKKIQKIFKGSILAKENDWSTEYLDSKISVKIVNDLKEAINHIKKYGTNHTECIISKNKNNIKTFEKNISSSIVMTNASTQFADGYEFGLGSEVGISTNKMHPRGPVGLEQLVTYKYIVNGKGQIRP